MNYTFNLLDLISSGNSVPLWNLFSTFSLISLFLYCCHFNCEIFKWTYWVQGCVRKKAHISITFSMTLATLAFMFQRFQQQKITKVLPNLLDRMNSQCLVIHASIASLNGFYRIDIRVFFFALNIFHSMFYFSCKLGCKYMLLLHRYWLTPNYNTDLSHNELLSLIDPLINNKI